MFTRFSSTRRTWPGLTVVMLVATACAGQTAGLPTPASPSDVTPMSAAASTAQVATTVSGAQAPAQPATATAEPAVPRTTVPAAAEPGGAVVRFLVPTIT